MSISKFLISATLLTSVAACGGGGGSSSASTAGSTNVLTGQFRDSSVSGLGYRVGGDSPLRFTTFTGGYEYVLGSPLEFVVGPVALGSTEGKPVITPIDLVPASDINSIRVANRARFLQLLDSDGDPSNGIMISDAVNQIAQNFPQIDFSTNDLANDPSIAAIQGMLGGIEGQNLTLPDAATAIAHLTGTIACGNAGAFMGTFTGDDAGTFGFLVDAVTGGVSGEAFNVDGEIFSFSAASAISLDQERAFASGIVGSNGSFSGFFADTNMLSGSFQNEIGNEIFSGQFSGSRIGGSAEAVFRFTGRFNGEDVGLFAFDIDENSVVTGIAYSVIDDELFSLSGSLSGTNLNVAVSNGTTVSGILDTSAGTVSGDFFGQASGTFSGNGCQLNPAN